MKEECKKVYHFTTDAAWECMNKGVDIWLYDASKHEHVDGMQVRGLWPMQRFLPDEYAVGLPAKAGDPVIEALLEPCPSGWTNNPEFPGYWNRLMRNILIHADSKDSRVLLLEARMQPCDDAWIVERAYAERVFSGQKTTTRFKKSEKEELFRRYWESRVPLFSYDGSYSLPQVVIWTPIPLERLSVVWEKPKMGILEDLANMEKTG